MKKHEDFLSLQGLIQDVKKHKVILDSELATLYGINVNELEDAVNRNMKRFPPEFLLQLDHTEWKELHRDTAYHAHNKKRSKHYAFTEQGILMLSNILKSTTAYLINIKILKTFVKLRIKKPL